MKYPKAKLIDKPDEDTVSIERDMWREFPLFHDGEYDWRMLIRENGSLSFYAAFRGTVAVVFDTCTPTISRMPKKVLARLVATRDALNLLIPAIEEAEGVAYQTTSDDEHEPILIATKKTEDES